MHTTTHSCADPAMATRSRLMINVLSNSNDSTVSSNPSTRTPSSHRRNPCASSSFTAGQLSLEEGQGESSCDHFVSRSQGRDLHVRPPASEDASMGVARSGGSPTPSRAASFFYDNIEQEQEYFQQVLGSSSQGWTDEKHSSYLDSMEAQFLKCVLFSKRNAQSELESSSELSDSASSIQAKCRSNEFKVCQNGRWRTRKCGPLAVAVRNPWIKRFRRQSPNLKLPALVLQEPLLQDACRKR